MLNIIIDSTINLTCKGLFIWKPGWPAKRDSPVSLISMCSYFYSKNYRAFIWTSGLARLPRSRLKEARSRLPGWKFLHINTHKRASPASGMKFSHINTREIHPAYWAVSLSGPARLPYKQALSQMSCIQQQHQYTELIN